MPSQGSSRPRSLAYIVGLFIQVRDGVPELPAWLEMLLRGDSEGFETVECVCLAADGGNESVIGTYDLGGERPRIQLTLTPSRGGHIICAIRQARLVWRILARADIVCCNIPGDPSTTFLVGLICKVQGRLLMAQLLLDWGTAIRISNKPTVTTKLKSLAGEFISRSIVRQAKLVLAQGRELYEKYKLVNPQAVRSEIVHSMLTEEAFWKRDSASLHSPVTLLTVARLVPQKGLEHMPSLLRDLLQRGIQAEWWCVGVGPLRAALEVKAEAMGVSDRVSFLGYVPLGPELFRIYRDADIFVLPSVTEGLPYAMLEAMANSLPVVVTAVGGIPAVITHERDGLMVRPGDYEELLRSICRIVDDQVLLSRLRGGAFQRAQDFQRQGILANRKKLIQEVFGPFNLGDSVAD